LEGQGWTVARNVAFIDVVAKRNDERLYAEAKGRTADMGTDLDTLYGQLLRRVPNEEVGKVRLGVVVPEEGRAAALRVQPRVRQLLSIDVFVVDETGTIELVRE
jgi:hypothetical protein